MRLMICAAACMLLLAALYGRGPQMPLFFVLAPLAVLYVPRCLRFALTGCLNGPRGAATLAAARRIGS